MLRNDVKSLLAEFTASMTSFTAIHACLFDREWLSTHLRPVDYNGYACALIEISAVAMIPGDENLTVFRRQE